MAEVRDDNRRSSQDAGHSDDLAGESSTASVPPAAASATIGSLLLEAIADLLPVGVFSVAIYDRLSGRGRKSAGNDAEVTAERS